MNNRWLVVVLLVAVISCQPEGDIKIEDEVRGIYISVGDYQQFHSKQLIGQAVDSLAEAGFNVVFPKVFQDGCTVYSSDFLSDYLNETCRPEQTGNKDLLQAISVHAHRNGMEVIPHFSFVLDAENSGVQDGIFETRREWIARDTSGDIYEEGGYRYLNSLLPEVQNFKISLIQEAVRNYDIDGILVNNEIASLPVNAGYNQNILERFEQATGYSEEPEPEKNNWLEWREEELDKFRESLYESVTFQDEQIVVADKISGSKRYENSESRIRDELKGLKHTDMILPVMDVETLQEYSGKVIKETGGIRDIYTDSEDLFVVPLLQSVYEHTAEEYSSLVETNRSGNTAGLVFTYDSSMITDSEPRISEWYNIPAYLPYRDPQRRKPGYVLQAQYPSVEQHGDWRLIDRDDAFEQTVLQSSGPVDKLVYDMFTPIAGIYDVYMHLPFELGTSNAVMELKQIDHDPVSQAVSQFDQRGWVRIATIETRQGERFEITVTAESERVVVSDAVMLLRNIKKELAKPLASGYDEPFDHVSKPGSPQLYIIK